MIQTLHIFAPILGALTLAWAAFYLSKNFHLRKGAERYLDDFYASMPNTKHHASRLEQIGERITRSLPFSLDTWKNHLEWAQRGGSFKDWGIGRLVGIATLYGCFGMIALLINPSPVSLLLPLATAIYPFISVRARANTVRRRVVRSLPELATLVASEMSAGISPEQAIQRTARLPGPASGLLAEILARARTSGRPLFGHRPVRGALVELCAQANLPELVSFTAQLELVAEKGVAGASLMNEVARNLSREYRSRLESQVEKLDNRLMLATAVFFFIPFVLIILGSFISPVMALFR